MTTTGQAAAGWYPDGLGQLRYYDGAAWTQHTFPMDELPDVPAPAEVRHTAPTVQAPVEPAAPPRRRRLLLVAVVAFAAVLVIGGAYVLLGGEGADGQEAASPTVTSTASAVAPGSPVTYGASPAVVAAAVACTEVRGEQQSEAASPVKFQRVTCSLPGATVEVDTYPSSKDQLTAEAALASFIGNGKYASGEGWIALDEKYSAETARAFASALGGAVKGA